MAEIRLKKIKKYYYRSSGLIFRRKKELKFSIDGLNLVIPDGQVMVILGPSGCGKTTLLRLIAGLEKIDGGEILFDGQNVENVSPKDKNIGMVFQDYALYPHFKSKNNILSYYLFNKNKQKSRDIELAKEKQLQKISELMEVDISQLYERKPNKLSGGEKQRVALARCIARKPELFLMDEPFSNLDAKMREKFRVNLKKLLDKFAITSIYVTHDQNEARLLADQVAIMKEGSVEQVGSYREIYEKPVNIFTARFLSTNPELEGINLIPGENFSPPEVQHIIGFRPGDVDISHRAQDDYLKGKILQARHLPGREQWNLNLQVKDTEITILAALEKKINRGQDLWFYPSRYFVFSKNTEKLIEIRHS